MLEFGFANTWEPDPLTDEEKEACIEACLDMDPGPAGEFRDYFIITQTEPYIDSVYLHFPERSLKPDLVVRFPFHEGYMWPLNDRILFDERCVNNRNLEFSHGPIQKIYDRYKELHPEWHLSRYHTESIRLLDHIYNCMQTNTVKEILYKAGLDDLAAYSCYMDEYNLLATKPGEIYDGIGIRALRALNCREGAMLLSASTGREYVKYLQQCFPDFFKEKMNDAQCRYIRDLIDNKLTPNEVGRLYKGARQRLMLIWNRSQYSIFMHMEQIREEILNNIRAINKIDPLYMKYLPQQPERMTTDQFNYEGLAKYLLHGREKYDRAIRVSNRKRNPEWQERDKRYVIRFPQTINDFCREAVYMHNCLSGYVDAMINNETTILFMRRTDDVNMPFITIEVYQNRLVEAYHRYNEDCTPEEADWIRAYCRRHGIDDSKYNFDRNLDMDFFIDDDGILLDEEDEEMWG